MIGFIDWTDNKINLYVFEKKNRQYIHSDTRSIPLTGELNQSFLASIFIDNLEYVYLSIPVNLISIRELDFPFSDRDKIRDTVSYELEGIVLGDVGDYVVDHVVTKTFEDSSHILAACMEKSKLGGIIGLFSSAGLEPAVITSIDLRFAANNPEMLFESQGLDDNIRIEAAREELSKPLLNLRQEELAYQGDMDRIKKSLRLTCILALILLLILCAGAAIKFTSLKKDNAFLKKEVNAVYSEVFPQDTKIVDAFRQFKGHLNDLIEKTTLMGGMPVLDMLLDIVRLKDSGITLDEFNADEEKIIIKGTAQSFETVDSFKNALSSSFKDVKVLDSKSLPDNKIIFSITMKGKNLQGNSL